MIDQNIDIKELIKHKKFMLVCFISTRLSGDPLQSGVTWYYLQSVILELIIKIYYELDVQKEAPFTHDLLKVFGYLNEDTKRFIEQKFNEARERKEEIFKRITDDVIHHELHEVLALNQNLIKNLKYDAMGVKANSSADGIFYKEIVENIERKNNNL